MCTFSGAVIYSCFICRYFQHLVSYIKSPLLRRLLAFRYEVDLYSNGVFFLLVGNFISV